MPDEVKHTVVANISGTLAGASVWVVFGNIFIAVISAFFIGFASYFGTKAAKYLDKHWKGKVKSISIKFWNKPKINREPKTYVNSKKQ